MVFRWDWLTRQEMETMDHTVGLKSPTIAGGLFSVGTVFLCTGQTVVTQNIQEKRGSTSSASMTIKWTFGVAKISSFLSVSGNVAAKWKLCLVPG